VSFSDTHPDRGKLIARGGRGTVENTIWGKVVASPESGPW
jgi:hypothetical protein